MNYVVDNNWSSKHIPFQKKHKTLPIVLKEEEIKSLLILRHSRYPLYGAGLRLSECLNLQINDIDSVNMVIAEKMTYTDLSPDVRHSVLFMRRDGKPVNVTF